MELLAQELAAKLNVDCVVVLRALLATVSLRKAGWQEPLASSLSGTHVGIFDCARGAGAAGGGGAPAQPAGEGADTDAE